MAAVYTQQRAGGAAIYGAMFAAGAPAPAPSPAPSPATIGGPASLLFADFRGEVQFPSTRAAQANWERFISSVKPTRID